MNWSVHILSIVILLTFVVVPKYTMMNDQTSSSSTGSADIPHNVAHEMLYIVEYPKNEYIKPAAWEKYTPHAVRAALRDNTEQILDYVASNVHFIAECFVTLKSVIRCYNIPPLGDGTKSIYYYLNQKVRIAKIPTIKKYELQLLGTVPFQPVKYGDDFETLEQLARKEGEQSLHQYNLLIETFMGLPSKRYFVESLFLTYLVIRHLQFRFGDYLRALRLQTVIDYLDRNTHFSSIFEDCFCFNELDKLKRYITRDSIDGPYYHRGIEVFLHCLKPIILILNGREKEVLYLTFIMYLNLVHNYRAILEGKEKYNFIRNHVFDQATTILQQFDYEFKPRSFMLDTETREPITEAQYFQIHRQHTCTTECSKYQHIAQLDSGYDIAKTYEKLVQLSKKKPEVQMVLDLVFAAIKERSKFGPKWIKRVSCTVPKAKMTGSEIFRNPESEFCNPDQFAEALRLDEMPCDVYINVRFFFDSTN